MSDQVAEVSAKYLADVAKTAVPVGYKQTEVGVIPEDWGVCELQDAVNFLDGLRRPVKSGDRAKISGIYPYYGASGIVDYVNDYIFDDELILLGEDGENILSRNLPLVFRVSGKIWVNNHAHVMKPNECFDITYLTEFLESLDYSLLNSGTAQPKLNKQACLKIKVAKPPKKEQTAIANTLSDVDALISELEKLITKKHAIKTATMQQLLTGRTRLPQFALREDGTPKGTKPSELGEIPEDWKAVALKELLKDSPKYGINAPAVPLEGKLPVYIRITDISEDGYFKPTEKVGVESPFSDLYQLADGDLVLARTGASVGKSYLYRPEDGVLVYAGFLIKVTPEQSKLDPKFLFQYLQTERYWSWVTVNSMRSGQPGINGNEYGSLMLPWPEKEEQTAIATILSDMDAEIQALEQRLGKTRQIKQGMMQELLTGKTRLIKGEAHG